MSFGLVDVVGTGAALCSMVSFAPQLIKLIREKDAEGVSLRMYMVTVTGFILWITYGVLIGKWPVVGSNSVCLVMATAILVIAWRLDRRSGH